MTRPRREPSEPYGREPDLPLFGDRPSAEPIPTPTPTATPVEPPNPATPDPPLAVSTPTATPTATPTPAPVAAQRPADGFARAQAAPDPPLSLVLVDDQADAWTLAAVDGGTFAVATFDTLVTAFDDELPELVHVRDVLAVVPRDAGPSLLARATAAIDRARPLAESCRIVVCAAWPCDRRLALPPSLDTSGAVWAWLSMLPERADPARNGHAARRVEATAADDDDSQSLDTSLWPAPPDAAAFYGLAGEIVRMIEPETEADPGGLLLQLLVMAGSVIGHSPHYKVEETAHHINENAVTVGDTAMGRKGTASERARVVHRAVDPTWADTRIMSGLSSGEGLITPVRDEIRQKEAIKEKGRVVDYREVIADQGVTDKRLLVLETEFGGALKALERDGNKLSALLRQAWDHGTLATLTKSPLRATGAHISIIGHITMMELRAELSEIDAANGLANRFLWLCVRRSKTLPHGGRPIDLGRLTTRLTEVITYSRHVGRMTMTAGTRTLWEDHYERLTTPPPGALGLVTSRAAPHTIRLAMLYALLDGTDKISPDHLGAALALWDAAARSAAYIFGDGTGNKIADKILAALPKAPDGMTRSEIRRKVFGDNIKADEVNPALALLISTGIAKQENDTATGGRHAVRFYAVRGRETRGIHDNPPAKGDETGTSHVNHVNHVHVGAGSEIPETADGDREVGEI
jgi:hypothetical protein